MKKGFKANNSSIQSESISRITKSDIKYMVNESIKRLTEGYNNEFSIKVDLLDLAAEYLGEYLSKNPALAIDFCKKFCSDCDDIDEYDMNEYVISDIVYCSELFRGMPYREITVSSYSEEVIGGSDDLGRKERISQVTVSGHEDKIQENCAYLQQHGLPNKIVNDLRLYWKDKIQEEAESR